MSEVWGKWEGQVVNGVFPLHRLLAATDYSAVFLTEFSAQNQPTAALKLVPAIPTLAAVQLSHWTAAAALSHPHLIRLLEMGRCQLGGLDFLFVVMDFAEQTLSKILTQRALTADEVREMMLPVLSALEYLHGQHLVQGRLMPANILAVGDQLKLASDTIRAAGESTAYIARPSVYDPPETSDGGFSAAGDMWSLGVTLIEALTQHPAASLPAAFPAEFADVVRQCLNPNAALRPTAAALKAKFAPAAPLPIVSAPQPAVVAPQPPTPPALAVTPPVPTTAPPVGKSAPPVGKPSPPAAPPAAAPVAPPAAPTIAKAKAAPPAAPATPPAESAAPRTAPVTPPVPTVARPAAPPVPTAAPPAAPVGQVATTITLAKDSSTLRWSIAALGAAFVVILAVWAGLHRHHPPPIPPVAASEPTGAAAPSTAGPAPVEQSAGPSASDPVLHQEIPNVPRSALATIHGRIQIAVRVTVDASGNVTHTTLENSGGSYYFARMAAAAAGKWKFVPAAQTVSRIWMLKFEFSRSSVTGRASAK